MVNPRGKAAVVKKLARIKSALAADKRKWGAWDDSRGLRYLSPGLFIKIEDWEGGLKYLKWFAKNFPDDIGMPEFLLEWAVILFKNNNLAESKCKVFEAFFSNTYLLDSFLGRSVVPVDKWEGSNLESPEYVQHVSSTHKEPELADFSKWLETLTSTDEFQLMKNKFTELNIKLKREKDGEIRIYLIAQIRQLETSFKSII
jgi:hypothetical protein